MSVVDAIRSGEIETEGRIKDSKAMAKKLQDLGMTKEEGKIWNRLPDANRARSSSPISGSSAIRIRTRR
jgi:hypothetical protein